MSNQFSPELIDLAEQVREADAALSAATKDRHTSPNGFIAYEVALERWVQAKSAFNQLMRDECRSQIKVRA